MSFRRAFEGTLLEILRTRALLSVAVLSVLFYAFYYPAPYAHQVVERLPVVLVDADHSAVSRAILRNLETANEIIVTADVPDMAAARAIVRARRAEGILLLPRGLSAALLAGRPGTGIAVWLNGAYLLRAEAVGKSIATAIAATAQRGLARLPDRLATVAPAVSTHPLYNTTEGYRDYIFPAVANVILQQTLLFSVARLVAERRRKGRWSRGGRAFVGTWAACTTIGTLAALLYFGLVFWFQDIPHGGNIPALLPVAPLFAATVAALAMLVGSVVRSGDDALKLLIPTSIPFVFLTGFAWPLFAMPPWVQAIAWTIPVTPAMHIFVPLNQMGATLGEVRGAVLVLLAQCAIFALVGYVRLATARVSPSEPITV
ncbi:ABC transporter permease [Sphingomonas sp. CARO-RG-8B-R24-01]|uniref:ABC transporter permease n=1 Tax=Sphingomonas sp. CARO-RG-8B-R24-01 TaxID=2914831 RepID=UPI001F5AADFC|nr:ABC transporter permease [Sphingomonas sp. CARO-RG-8B-R24-01]